MRLPWDILYLRDGKGTMRKVHPSVPFLKVTVSYGEKHVKVKAIVDSGASCLLMSKAIADELGVDLGPVEPKASGGVSGGFLMFPFEGIKLTVLGMGEELDVEAAFTKDQDKNGLYHPLYPLLGINALFTNYIVTIDAFNRTIDLDPLPTDQSFLLKNL